MLVVERGLRAGSSPYGSCQNLMFQVSKQLLQSLDESQNFSFDLTRGGGDWGKGLLGVLTAHLFISWDYDRDRNQGFLYEMRSNVFYMSFLFSDHVCSFTITGVQLYWNHLFNCKWPLPKVWENWNTLVKGHYIRFWSKALRKTKIFPVWQKSAVSEDMGYALNGPLSDRCCRWLV